MGTLGAKTPQCPTCHILDTPLIDKNQVYIIHIRISNNTILVNNQCITDIKQVYIIHIKISNNTILVNNQCITDIR